MGKRVVFIMALFATLATSPVVCAGPDDDDTMTQYLEKLGLVRLEITHLELILQKPQPTERRVQIAKKLADLYAAQLIETAGDPTSNQDLMARIDRLVQEVPQANTPSLRVMMLQADYNHAESLVVRWIGNPAESEARDQAAEILDQITPELDQYQQQLNTQAEALSDEIDQMPEGDALDRKEEELRRLQPVVGRASYFAGWAHYYVGLIEDEEDGGSFEKARDIFRDLLDIPTGDYESLDAEWLGLESTWRARTLIGLGLAEAAAGDLDASRRCFQLLDHVSVPAEIQDQAAYWYVQGLLNAGRYVEAADFAEETIGNFSEEATQGRVSLCVTLIRAGFANADDVAMEERRRLGLLGLEGLARLRQQRAVRTLMEQYGIQLEGDGGFYLRWLQGRQLLATAEESKQEDDYRVAAKALEDALASSDAGSEVRSAAQCRYELAWCLYQLGEYESAARHYEQAVTGLKISDATTASQAAWMTFACYHKLSADQPRYTTLAIDALTRIKREFPASSYAQKADYYLRKLNQDSTAPEETLASLEQVKLGTPAYLSARYDICLITHQLWNSTAGPTKTKWGQAVRNAVDAYLAAAGSDQDADRKLKCLLLCIDVALNGIPEDRASAASYLRQAASLAASLPPASALAAEYHYRQLQLAGKTGDAEGRRDHADWLVANAAGSAYEVPALVVAAKAVDEAVRSAAASAEQALDQEAYTVYSRLADRLGASPEILQSQKNARVASSKAAEFAFRVGRFTEAANRLERLLAAFPKDRGYLARAARVQFELGDYDHSLPHWRTLLAGTDKGSDAWYEAKYYQIKCLQQTDPAAANKVFDQFRLLYPDMGPQQWRERFESLFDDDNS